MLIDLVKLFLRHRETPVDVLTSSVAFFQFSLYRKTVKNADCIEIQIKNPVHIPARRKEEDSLV